MGTFRENRHVRFGFMKFKVNPSLLVDNEALKRQDMIISTQVHNKSERLKYILDTFPDSCNFLSAIY